MLDISDTAVRNWILAYEAGGMKALAAKKQGHAEGVGRFMASE